MRAQLGGKRQKSSQAGGCCTRRWSPRCNLSCSQVVSGFFLLVFFPFGGFTTGFQQGEPQSFHQSFFHTLPRSFFFGKLRCWRLQSCQLGLQVEREDVLNQQELVSFSRCRWADFRTHPYICCPKEPLQVLVIFAKTWKAQKDRCVKLSQWFPIQIFIIYYGMILGIIRNNTDTNMIPIIISDIWYNSNFDLRISRSSVVNTWVAKRFVHKVSAIDRVIGILEFKSLNLEVGKWRNMALHSACLKKVNSCW